MRLDFGDAPRRLSFDRSRQRRDMRRRSAAAAADDIEPAVVHPVAQLRRQGLGSFRKAGRQERIGKARVGMATDVDRRDLRQLVDQRAHFFRTQRAVHAHAQKRHMGNGIPKGFDGLPGDAAVAARLNECHRRHQRQLYLALVEKLQDRKERRLRIERVENGLDQQQVGAAIDQAARLVIVGLNQFVIGHAARRRTMHVGGDRAGPVSRTDGAGDKAGSRRIFRLYESHRPLGVLRSRDVQVVGVRLQFVVRH